MSVAGPALIAWSLGLALFAGCTEEEAGAVDASAAVALPTFHTRYGFPGPWSREGATRSDFDGDSRACLTRSNDARRETGNGDRNEVAYRTFIECMAGRGWARGLTPRPRRVSDVPASRAPRPFN